MIFKKETEKGGGGKCSLLQNKTSKQKIKKNRNFTTSIILTDSGKVH
jgi:hypothetical protein